MSAERRIGFVLLAGLGFSAIIGAGLGVLWWRLVPRVPLVIRPEGALPEGFQPEGFLAADVVFAALAILAGIAITIGLASMRREHLISVLIASILGSVIGVVAMYFVGTRLGSVDIEGLIATTVEAVTVDAPLEISMPAVLVMWPAASALVVTVLAAGDVMHARRQSKRSVLE